MVKSILLDRKILSYVILDYLKVIFGFILEVNNMRLEQLEYLVAIDEKRSINLASQKLHIAQQSLSKAIQNLEEELDVTLLYRSAQGTKLTKEGEIVLYRAKRIFAELEKLKNELDDYFEEKSSLCGTLKVFYNNSFDYILMMSSVQNFRKDYPNVRFTFQQRSLSNILESIYDGIADIGLLTLSSQYHLNRVIEHHKLQSLVTVLLNDDALLVAISKMNPLSNYHSISLSTVLKNPLILYLNEASSVDTLEEITQNWLVQILHDFGDPKFVMTVNSLNLYMEAIIKNSGIGFLTKTSINNLPESQLEKIQLIPLRPAIALDSIYVTRIDQQSSALIQAYLPYLEELCKI